MDDHTPFKRCSKCGECFPATPQYFYRQKTGRGGLRAECKSCTNKQSSEYKAAHPEQTRRIRREWNRAHPEKAKPALAKWREANKEHVKAYSRQYNVTHTGEWFRAHPGKRRIYKQSRIARQRSLPATFTDADWLRALDYFGNRCAVCGRPRGLWHTLAQDHWIPISKGGGYTLDNIVPLCHGRDGCNNSKFDKLPVDWLTERYGKRKARQIIARIEAYFESVKTA